MFALYSLLSITPLSLLVSASSLESADADTTAAPAQRFRLRDKYIGRDFLDGFNWETFDDPTGGRVNYVDQGTALSRNLTYTSDNKFVMRADNNNVVPPGARGRDSVRITSHSTHTDSVIVLDLQHMPEGCATWPAFWTLTQAGPWPTGGEVDIIEGINQNTHNLASLHTTENCTIPAERQQTGSADTSDCYAFAKGNAGCGSRFSKDASYGRPLNAAGGGWFVVTRSNADGISMYFWGRGDRTVPPNVRSPGASITPDKSWGLPEARFPTASCDFSKHFDKHQIIIDLTFCGAWAGNKFEKDGCGAGPCNDFVDYNPQAFANAYWEINALRVYT